MNLLKTLGLVGVGIVGAKIVYDKGYNNGYKKGYDDGQDVYSQRIQAYWNDIKAQNRESLKETLESYKG